MHGLVFQITLGEDAFNLSDIMELKKGHLTNLIYLLFKRHILIKMTSRFLTVVLEANIKSANPIGLTVPNLGSKPPPSTSGVPGHNPRCHHHSST